MEDIFGWLLAVGFGGEGEGGLDVAGCWVLDVGCWCWVLDAGCWEIGRTRN